MSQLFSGKDTLWNLSLNPFIIIYVACGGKVCEVFGGKKG